MQSENWTWRSPAFRPFLVPSVSLIALLPFCPEGPNRLYPSYDSNSLLFVKWDLRLLFRLSINTLLLFFEFCQEKRLATSEKQQILHNRKPGLVNQG